MNHLQRSLAWLFSLNARGMKLGLENTRELMRRLGDPQNDFKSIHVAGSNGKGSVCALIHSIMAEAGISTGLYTSPHLLRFNERIRIGSEQIDDYELSELIDRCRPIVEEMAADGKELTFFEITTAMAFLYFSEKGAEYVVLETGMGGRLDSTNVVNPSLSVITPISMEHSEYLGRTLNEIATEKAGIIKPDTPVVANCVAEVRDLVSARAAELGSTVRYLEDEDYSLVSMSREGIVLTYHGTEYEVSISGSIQAGNAATAILALEVLNDNRIGQEHIGKGLSECLWPCRMELVEKDPPTVVDVTHTTMGAKSLAKDFPLVYGPGNILVIGVLLDKDLAGIASALGPVFRKVVATEPDSDRGMAADAVGRAFMHHCEDVTVEEKVGDAIRLAYDNLEKGETVLVTGSLYTAGDALRWLAKRTPS